MTTSMLAKELKISSKTLEKRGAKAFLEKELLNTNAELLNLSFKYEVRNIEMFDKLIKKGVVHETSETRKDFFLFDELTAKKEKLEKLIKIYGKSRRGDL